MKMFAPAVVAASNYSHSFFSLNIKLKTLINLQKYNSQTQKLNT